MVGTSLSARAQSLSELLGDLVTNSERVKIAEKALESSKEGVREAWGGWFPTLDVTGSIGKEQQVKPKAENTDFAPKELDLSITQQVWDFGSTNASIDTANLQVQQSGLNLIGVRQSLLLEGLTAYLEMKRAFDLLDLSKGAEARIKEVMELEDARVQRGSGFSTDVLQAKRNLAGSQAQRVRNEGQLKTALNRYSRLFGSVPDKPKRMKEPRLPVELIPETLEAATQIAFDNNPSIKSTRIGEDLALADLRKTKADELAPTLDVVGEFNSKHDASGTGGYKNEKLLKLELNYSLNMGLTSINTIRSARYTADQSTLALAEIKKQITEQVRNFWDAYHTAKENADLLENQSNIAFEFLELARKERNLGRRTLIDVLDGETQLINATSTARSARTDVSLAVFRLLAAMGQLDLDLFKDVKPAKKSATPVKTAPVKTAPVKAAPNAPGEAAAPLKETAPMGVEPPAPQANPAAPVDKNPPMEPPAKAPDSDTPAAPDLQGANKRQVQEARWIPAH